MQSLEKLAWGNRGFDDAYKGKPMRTRFPTDVAREVYQARYAVGKRERAQLDTRGRKHG